MKVALMVIGWLLIAAGFVISLMVIIDGPSKPDNAVTSTPAATVMVAGAVLVLAGVLCGRGNERSPNGQQPFGAPPSAPQLPPTGAPYPPGR